MGDLLFTDGAQGARGDAGFTVIEILVTVAIVAILLALAGPSFRYVTTANRASSEINALLGDMQFARAEAIREGQPVTVCATTDGVACAGAGVAWNGGWFVFSDPGNTGVMPAGAALKFQKAFSSQDSLQADQGINLVTFSRDGFALSLPNPMKFTLKDSTANAQYTRCLSLTIVGALSTQIGGALTAEGSQC